MEGGAEGLEDDDPLGKPNPLLHWARDGKASFGTGKTALLANWIGRVIAGYSAIEFEFYMTYALLSEAHAKESYRTFYALRSIKRKQNLFTPYLTTLPPELKDSLVVLLRSLRSAAAKRTEVAHCVLTESNSHVISIRLNGNKEHFSNLEKNYFTTTVNQYRTLQTDAYIFQVYLGLLFPDRRSRILDELPLPQHAKRYDRERPDPGPLPPHVEAARIESIKRLGLESVIVLERSAYRYHRYDYRLRYNGHLVLMIE